MSLIDLIQVTLHVQIALLTLRKATVSKRHPFSWHMRSALC